VCFYCAFVQKKQTAFFALGFLIVVIFFKTNQKEIILVCVPIVFWFYFLLFLNSDSGKRERSCVGVNIENVLFSPELPRFFFLPDVPFLAFAFRRKLCFCLISPPEYVFPPARLCISGSPVAKGPGKNRLATIHVLLARV